MNRFVRWLLGVSLILSLVGCRKKSFSTAAKAPVIPPVTNPPTRNHPTPRKVMLQSKLTHKNPAFAMNCKGVTSHKGKLKLRLQRLLKKVRIRALTDIAFAPGYPKMLFLTEQQSGKFLCGTEANPHRRPCFTFRSSFLMVGNRDCWGLLFILAFPAIAGCFCTTPTKKEPFRSSSTR